MEKMLMNPKRPWTAPWRWAKTLFFLLAMVSSLLYCATPLLVALLDVVVSSALFSAASPARSPSLAAQLRGYTLSASLVDLPLVSVARSAIVLLAYAACDGRGPYLPVAVLSGAVSLAYVSLKSAACAFVEGPRRMAAEALLLASLALGMAHIVAAYRTSCRERRRLLVCRIDIEAVSALKGDVPSYQRLHLPNKNTIS